MRFRKERVAGAIQEIVSDAITRKINDPRLAPLTTVSRVTVSGDLTVATVYFTVVGDQAIERRSLAALQHARGFVQHLVAEQIDLRQCPELRFEVDEVAKKARETMQILDENRQREPHLYEAEKVIVGKATSDEESVEQAASEGTSAERGEDDA
jgi:ribosome-binding factor A